MKELTSIPTREIRAALLQSVPGAPIVRLVREPVQGKVERLRVRREGGARQVLLGKFGSRTGDRRELLAYLHLLSPAETYSPELAGVATEQGWLFVAEVPGRVPDLADAGQVQAVYEALGIMHRRFTQRAPSLLDGPAAFALRSSFRTTLDAGDYERTFARADLALRAVGISLPLLERAGGVARDLEATGLTLVHGDFHAGNICWDHPAVSFLDWEDCGIGTPLHDLAYVEPEAEEGWSGAPHGALALYALQVYHEAGPLAHLTWDEFVHVHRSACLWERVRLVAVHAEKLARAKQEGAPADVIEVIRQTLTVSLARSAMAARTLKW